MPEVLLSPPSTVPSQGGSNAFDLLCLCCAADPGPEQIAQITGWHYADLDWEDFLRQAGHHGVLSLVARNLLDRTPCLPPQIRSSLESAYSTNFRRGLWFASELMRITRQLALNHVRAIPYKGAVLAQSAYGDLALRNFSDLDLLISPADFEQAKRALSQIGYLPTKTFTPAVEHLWLKTGYERSFDGPGGKHLVELQWAILPYFYAIDPASFQFDDLWSRTGRIVLGTSDDSGVRLLSAEDSLLVLCVHAAKHLWTRLIWIADIAHGLRAPDLDLALVVSQARALGIARILAISLWLAKRLFQTSVPAPADELIARDQDAPRFGKEFVARLSSCTSYDFESTEYFSHILQMRERARDRRRYLWRLIWTPGQGDIDALSLPEMLFPLYRGIRVARLLGKLVQSRPSR